MKSNATDWDAYYKSTPGYTQFTRSITSRKLETVLVEVTGGTASSVCELGGANSSFLNEIVRALGVKKYHVIDANAYGLSLLDSRRLHDCAITTEIQDVLTDRGDPSYDLVFSIGLIEHFDAAKTKIAIEAHFNRCKPGGVVLMTFPTPTIPYRAIRGAAELLGKWSFPDERPLLFPEVECECRRYGEIIHVSTNWWIGLTQGYVATRKRSAP